MRFYDLFNPYDGFKAIHGNPSTMYRMYPSLWRRLWTGFMNWLRDGEQW